jgi:hypothetical protein
MSDTDFSEDEYLPLKYPSSGKFAEKISSFKILEKDSIEAGPSKEYVSSGNVKENTFEKACSQCDKSFKSEKGLKTHNGRIHRAQKYFSTGNNKFEDIKSSPEEKLKKHPQILNINDHSKIYEGKQLLILLKENLANAKSHIKTIRRIPKGARYSAAVKLCTIIKECLDSNSITAWSNLLLFSYKVFNISEKSLKKSLTSVIKENVINFNLQENGKKKINKPSLSKL